MAKRKKATHGGPRKGAGRTVGSEGRAQVVAASVPSELVERLDAYIAKNGGGRSKAITDAIRGLLDAKR
jgi:hypothetical protein